MEVTFAHHVVAVASQALPNIRSDLNTLFLDRICCADPMIEVELESALVAKSSEFQIRDLPTIAHILNTYNTPGSTTATSTLEKELSLAKEATDLNVWDSFIKELDYDKKCIRVHVVNLLAAHKTTGQERDIWKSKVRADLKTNILSFMDGHSDCIDTAVAENKRRSHMIAKFQKVVDDTAKRYGVEPCQIITVPLLNYAAPSLVKADARTGHINTLQYILNHNTNNIALLLRPCHAYKKGEVWMSEQALVKLFASICHVDQSFSLFFDGKCHQRDERPMKYDGLVLSPKGVDISTFWDQSSLVNYGYCGPVKQLPPKNMEVIEALDESSLPTGDGHPRGAAKHGQIGAEAWAKLLSSLFDGVTLSSKTVVLIMDLTASVTHTFQAALDVQRTMSDHSAVHWSGFFEGENKIEWWRHEVCDLLTSQVAAGTCTLPGVIAVDQNVMPPQATTLPFPTLKRCVWLPAKDNELLPGAMISETDERAWTSHSNFASDFKTVLNEFTGEFGAYGDRQIFKKGLW